MSKNIFRPVDIITYLYILINILYIFFGWERVHNPHIHFFVFIAIGIIIFLLIKYGYKSKTLTFFRDWYPVFAFSYFFEVTSALNKVIFPDFIDSFFQKIDFAIFGYQPAIEWGIKFDSYLLNEIMSFAYFSYYLMFPLLGLLLYFKNRKAFHRFIFLTSFVFYICYLTYNILPVIGGRFWSNTIEITTTYRYGIFTRILAFIYNQTTHLGGAVPSSHVAIAIVITISALRNRRWLGWVFVILTFFLSISTVYLHYHYFIDVIAGLIYGFGFYYLGLIILKKLNDVRFIIS